MKRILLSVLLLLGIALPGQAQLAKIGSATAPGNDTILEAHLKAVDSASDEECLTYEATVGDFEWQACTNLVDDTTPQLGGMLDVNGNSIGDGTLELLSFIEDASAVNHINIENQATGSAPILSAVGDDTNIDLYILTKGTGTVRMASGLLVDSGQAFGVSMGILFGDGDTTLYEISDDTLIVGVANTERWSFIGDQLRSFNAAGALLANEASSATNPTLSPRVSGATTGIGAPVDAELSVIVTADEAVNFSESSNLISSKFDAGDNAAGNVGAWTTVSSAVATVTGSAAATLTASNLIPAGSFLLGLTARITTGFGTSSGLTDFDVGDGSDVDRWANSLGITSGITMNITNATAASNGSFAAANDVVLTSVGGNFDATGVIEIIAHYITLVAPTS